MLLCTAARKQTPLAHSHVPAVQRAVPTRARAVRGALQGGDVKGGGVCLAPALVVVRDDVLAHVVLLQRRQGVTLLTAQRQRQGTHGYGAAGAGGGGRY